MMSQLLHPVQYQNACDQLDHMCCCSIVCRNASDLSKRPKRIKANSSHPATLDCSTIPTNSSSCEEPSYPFAVPIHAYSNSSFSSSQHASFSAQNSSKDTEKPSNNSSGTTLTASSRSGSPTVGLAQGYMHHDSSSNSGSSIFTGSAAASAASAAAAAAASVLRFNVVGSPAGTSPLPTYGSLKKGVNTVVLDMATMSKR